MSTSFPSHDHPRLDDCRYMCKRGHRHHHAPPRPNGRSHVCKREHHRRIGARTCSHPSHRPHYMVVVVVTTLPHTCMWSVPPLRSGRVRGRFVIHHWYPLAYNRFVVPLRRQPPPTPTRPRTAVHSDTTSRDYQSVPEDRFLDTLLRGSSWGDP